MGLLKSILKGAVKTAIDEPTWKKMGFLDEEEYEDWCEEMDEDDEVEFDEGFYKSIRKPAGCRACGGDYPRCCDACPMFDD